MASFFSDNEDLRFYFDKGVDWDTLVRLTEGDLKAPGAHASVKDAVEFYREIATMVGEFAADEIAPHAAEIDREGVVLENGEACFPERLQGIFDRIKELELHGMCLPRELGGMNAPLLLYFMCGEMIGRADVCVMAHHGFHGGIALAMLIFSLERARPSSIPKKLDPETHALGASTSRRSAAATPGAAWTSPSPTPAATWPRCARSASRTPSGNWFVTGQKIFITSGTASTTS